MFSWSENNWPKDGWDESPWPMFRWACSCSPIYRERKAESEFLYWIGSLQLKSFKTWLWSALENVMFFWMSGLVVHCRIRRWRFFQVLGNDSSNFICFQELWSSLGHPQKNGNGRRHTFFSTRNFIQIYFDPTVMKTLSYPRPLLNSLVEQFKRSCFGVWIIFVWNFPKNDRFEFHRSTLFVWKFESRQRVTGGGLAWTNPRVWTIDWRSNLSHFEFLGLYLAIFDQNWSFVHKKWRFWLNTFKYRLKKF